MGLILTLLAFMLAAFIFIGAGCGIYAAFRLGKVNRELNHLRREAADAQFAVTPTHEVVDRRDGYTKTGAPPAAAQTARQAQKTDAALTPAPAAVAAPAAPPARPPVPPPVFGAPAGSDAAEPLTRLLTNMRRHWMILLGGFCVAIGGILLASYAINYGVLGPGGRFILGMLAGAAMHIVAERLRRRHRFGHRELAVLAGAGSITLYSATYAAMRWFDILPVGAALALMAVIALLTLWMALLHGKSGQILALVGILGAFLVPLAVPEKRGGMLVVLIYALIVGGSGLLILRFFNYRWLWNGILAGVLLWWAAAFSDPAADVARVFYLTLAGYGFLAIPAFDWKLRARDRLDISGRRFNFAAAAAAAFANRTAAVMLFLIAAQGVSLAAAQECAWFAFAPFSMLLLTLAARRESLAAAPWLFLLVQAGAWLAANTGGGFLTLKAPAGEERDGLVIWGVVNGVLYSAWAVFNLRQNRFRVLWSSLAALAPLLAVSIVYLLSEPLFLTWQWSAQMFIFGMIYLAVAAGVKKTRHPAALVVWLFFGGHYALALAAVIFFGEANLTLALAAQLISAAWIIRAFSLPQIGVLVKLLAGVIIIRLSLLPWLYEYKTAALWSLLTYALSAAACIAAYCLIVRRRARLALWLEGSAAHLLLLTFFTGIRYMLHGDDLFNLAAAKIGPPEAAVYLCLFAVLSLLYYSRGGRAGALAPLYRAYSLALLALALLIQAGVFLATAASGAWLAGDVGGAPFFNLTFAFYVLPALFAAAGVFVFPKSRQPAMFLYGGVNVFVYLSLQIHIFWSGGLSFAGGIGENEMYTYSLVWLLIALAMLLTHMLKTAAAARWRRYLHNPGMALLIVVAVKLFVADLAGLDGLLRVASFLGLGLSLLGISWLRQKLNPKTPRNAENAPAK